jgi:hypothetical protein
MHAADTQHDGQAAQQQREAEAKRQKRSFCKSANDT